MYVGFVVHGKAVWVRTVGAHQSEAAVYLTYVDVIGTTPCH